MSGGHELVEVILGDARFQSALEAVSVLSLLEDLPRIDPELPPANIDWSYALLCASALSQVPTEAAADAALRIAQGCFLREFATDRHRAAATVILERMGNGRSVQLAEQRAWLVADAWTDAPVPLQLDVIRRRLELGIPLPAGERITGNPFQRDFWTAAGDHGWLSVSAPTSAGKSYIVKRWFEARAQLAEGFRGVYLVPTRALIEEVGRDLRRDFGDDIPVFTVPWDRDIGTSPREIYVVTQERLNVLFDRDAAFAPDLLFIDEAQKIADDTRGVLLQAVLDEAVRRRPRMQVLFASPSSRNPELLLEGAPADQRPSHLSSEVVTVNQSLLWVDSAGKGAWSVDLVVNGEPRRVGTVTLSETIPARQRLPKVAVALAGAAPGNVVYVNGAADAEHAAEIIASELGDQIDLSRDEEIVALQDLIKTTVHAEYRLRGVLRHGVAFHYGNMPLILRAEIERLFRAETIRYLVCTSTLLEGVNLPCRTLFARAPRRGNNRPMTSADFWNLAGRAGRWGTEFRGNIVCVDTRARVWAQVPRKRQRERLTRAADAILGDPTVLEVFIADEKPADAARGAPLPAAVLSFLATRVQAGRPLASIPGVNLTAEQAQRLTTEIRAALTRVELPSGMYARHPGVSPLAMQVLLDYFRGHPEPETLPLELPDTPPARLSYVKALSRCRDYLGASMFGNDDRCAMLGMLVRNWMRGYPLARIIEERIRFLRDDRRDPKFDRDTTIRATLDDVEQIARFAAPRYLACYHEVHSFFLGQHDRRPLIDTETLTMMLELGVSRPTGVSLMSVGLSRTSALALSALIENNDLTPEAVLTWLREQQLDRLQVPALVRREAGELIAALRDRP